MFIILQVVYFAWLENIEKLPVQCFVIAPRLPDTVQEASSPIYGPLWVSVGEAFSPTGTIHFIKYLRRTIKGQLKEAVKYKNQVTCYIPLTFSLFLFVL